MLAPATNTAMLSNLRSLRFKNKNDLSGKKAALQDQSLPLKSLLTS